MMTNRRSYRTIKDMNNKAMEQWREFSIRWQLEDRSCDTDEQLWEYASEMIALSDENGVWGEEVDGEYVPYFTMEMESWARDTTDGIEAEILIEDEYEEMYGGLMWECAEGVLDDELTEEEFDAMLHDWKAFTYNPRKYSGTVVIDMVKLWLNERRNK